ncbi:hypothetical protein [Pseudooceanicola spongiae]|jgi:hypothetical protein|nr:hypothetical protein [Pseudooceanicola spongiae]
MLHILAKSFLTAARSGHTSAARTARPEEVMPRLRAPARPPVK